MSFSKQAFFSWILSTLLILGWSTNGYTSVNCQTVHLSEVTKAIQALSDDARRVQGLLEENHPSESQMLSLTKSWQLIDKQILGQNWEGFYDNKNFSKFRNRQFEEVQKKQMSPSTMIVGQNSSEKRIDQAEQNWRKADRQIHDWVMSATPLSIERMFELNKIIGEKLFFNQSVPGQRRTIRVGIPYEKEGKGHFQAALESTNIDPMLILFMDWFRSNENKVHPIQLAAQVYIRLNTIHPFPDGNGRTTRLVMDWVLRGKGYPPGVFLSTDSTYVVIFPHDLLRRNPEPGFVEIKVTNGLQWVADILNSTQATPLKATGT